MGMDIRIIIKVAATVMATEAIRLESTLVVARTRTELIITATTQTIIVTITIQE